MNPDEPLPELYKLPPLEIQAYDEWQKDSNDDGSSQPEPEPDYSDSDDNDNNSNHGDGPETYNATVWKARKANLQDHINTLTKQQYEAVVGSAEPMVDIPEPDYLDEPGESPSDGESPPGSPSYSSRIFSLPPTNGETVEPKKLINPCLESRERQDLHKELMLNQKLGVDVLHQKTELKKELERRRENNRRREQEEYLRNKRSSLEVKLEAQANKLRDPHTSTNDDPVRSKTIEEETPEFLKVHSKINRAKQES